MYQHIMVPLDGSELAECVLPHLDSIVAGGQAEKVTLVCVEQPLHVVVSGHEPEAERRPVDGILFAQPVDERIGVVEEGGILERRGRRLGGGGHRGSPGGARSTP